MASSWKEHLCLRRLEYRLFELSVCKYECLGEASDYADEDGNMNLPDQIDGKTVADVEPSVPTRVRHPTV
jgi:hypothetical protein